MQTIDCMGVDPPTPTVQGSTVHECIHGDFQPFPSHGTHKLITKILRHTKKVFFCQSENKIGIILIHSHQMAIVLEVVVIFLFDNLREKRSVLLTN